LENTRRWAKKKNESQHVPQEKKKQTRLNDLVGKTPKRKGPRPPGAEKKTKKSDEKGGRPFEKIRGGHLGVRKIGKAGVDIYHEKIREKGNSLKKKKKLPAGGKQGVMGGG